jgi:DNA-binding XRE family transcriptional regulator
MMLQTYPTSQGELIRSARASATQAEFARFLGVDRSCLSRYESEVLGAPAAVINACLQKIALQLKTSGIGPTALRRSLTLARELIAELETASEIHVPTSSEHPATQGNL